MTRSVQDGGLFKLSLLWGQSRSRNKAPGDNGLPDRSCYFVSRVQPAMEHRGGNRGIKCPRPNSFLPSLPTSSPCACPQLEAKGKRAYSVSLQVSFLGQRAGWKTWEGIQRGKWKTIWFPLERIIIWFIIRALTLQKMYHKHFWKTSNSSFLNNLERIPGWRFIKLKWGKKLTWQ